MSVAGNMLAGEATVRATLEAYLGASGSMAERLSDALEAGEKAGGDKRGKQSAGLKIARAIRIPTSISAPTIIPIHWPNCAGCTTSAWSASRCSGGCCREPTAHGVRLDRAIVDAAIARDRVPPA